MKRCVYCRERLGDRNQSGYCYKRDCLRHRYNHDMEFRDKMLQKNKIWHEKHKAQLKRARAKRMELRRANEKTAAY